MTFVLNRHTQGTGKYIIVGEASDQHEDPTKPFSGWSGERLRKLCTDLTLEEWRSYFNLSNVFDQWLGKENRGDAWNSEQAVLNIQALIREVGWTRHTWILLGRRVGEAFNRAGMFLQLHKMMFLIGHRTPYEEGRVWGDYLWDGISGDLADVYPLPHPSGIVRWWNDPDNLDAAQRMMSRVWIKSRAVTHKMGAPLPLPDLLYWRPEHADPGAAPPGYRPPEQDVDFYVG